MLIHKMFLKSIKDTPCSGQIKKGKDDSLESISVSLVIKQSLSENTGSIERIVSKNTTAQAPRTRITSDEALTGFFLLLLSGRVENCSLRLFLCPNHIREFISSEINKSNGTKKGVRA
jgi:hypothetical protein